MLEANVYQAAILNKYLSSFGLRLEPKERQEAEEIRVKSAAMIKGKSIQSRTKSLSKIIKKDSIDDFDFQSFQDEELPKTGM